MESRNRLCFEGKCEFGIYSMGVINKTMQLHKAKEIRNAVAQEIDWLSETCRKPATVDAVPSCVVVNNFHSKIHNSPYSRVMEAIDMTPGELAQLCGERYLYGDHMRWIVQTLNKQQNEMFCSYANSVVNANLNVRQYLEAKNMTLPKKIGLIFNVCKTKSTGLGQQQCKVQITPSFGSPGTHFSIAIVDTEYTFLYCHSRHGNKEYI